MTKEFDACLDYRNNVFGEETKRCGEISQITMFYSMFIPEKQFILHEL